MTSPVTRPFQALLLAPISESTCFFLGALSDMPAVRAFALRNDKFPYGKFPIWKISDMDNFRYWKFPIRIYSEHQFIQNRRAFSLALYRISGYLASRISGTTLYIVYHFRIDVLFPGRSIGYACGARFRPLRRDGSPRGLYHAGTKKIISVADPFHFYMDPDPAPNPT